MASNVKQSRFVREYAVDCNGAAAAVRAGYSPRSAKVTASRLLTKANCHDPCGSPWMMEDTGGVRASAGRGRSIL